MAVNLLQLAFRFFAGRSPDDTSDLMYCAYDGQTILHPPCYANKDSRIVDECIQTFTGQLEQAIWPNWQQKKALERWSQCHDRLDTTIWKEGLDLQFFFQLFADSFFCTPKMELAHRVKVQWIDYNPNSPPCQTKAIQSPDNHPRALIKIQKANPTQRFTGETAQRILCTLLHQMAHAFFICYACDVTRSGTVGVTGHGPLWVKLCAAIEMETESRFKGLPGRWDLDCQEDGTSVECELRARDRFERKPLVEEERERRAGRARC